MVRIAKWHERRQQLAIIVGGWEDEEFSAQYARWISRHFARRGERALIKARQHYEKLRPERIRAGALRRAYGHKGR